MSNRTTLIATVAVLALAGNVAQFVLNAGTKLDLDQARKEATFYKENYQRHLGKEAQLAQDFSAMYANSVKQLREAAAKGDRKGAMDALDSANFLSGFLSRHTQDGTQLRSGDYAAALAKGKLTAAQLKEMETAITNVPARTEQAVQRLLALRDQTPADAEAAQPAGMPASTPASPSAPVTEPAAK